MNYANWLVFFASENVLFYKKQVSVRSSPQGKVMRARIGLAADEHVEWSNQQITAYAGCTDQAVRKWRQRWSECKSLEDLPRPGAPKLFPI